MRRVRPRSELERAAPGGRLLLEYQPMVRLADSAAVGFDALTRCNHPARGRLGPAEFIDIAEESDTISRSLPAPHTFGRRQTRPRVHVHAHHLHTPHALTAVRQAHRSEVCAPGRCALPVPLTLR
ncbi:EAL domain-containing protein [Catellatospora coxensis]|uniref:EAL domain-containing protein n=1 Tax=Catellatospora coxensis TaxID=310354 RepID=A0A8J3KTG6_9ACTN|nr:EAL domain-containing protein [Catellatospora coxensis]GIG04769.1 hypothetical protein Cco03nite_14690 [Catellatospora coxensis]